MGLGNQLNALTMLACGACEKVPSVPLLVNDDAQVWRF